MAHAVVRRFSAASGPVLARGLAFVALFALVPAILVILSIVGVFVADPTVRARIVAILTDQVPLLAPVLDEALASFSGLAPATGIVGLLLLVWSASSLVRALDGTFRVVFEDDSEGRTPVRDVVALLAVAGAMAAAAAILVLTSLARPPRQVEGGAHTPPPAAGARGGVKGRGPWGWWGGGRARPPGRQARSWG